MSEPVQNDLESAREATARTVSFVLPAWNEERDLERCLQSIDLQVLPTGVQVVEVIVVDNQSTDQTPSIARNHGARVISVPPGRVSRARNAGAHAAVGEFIAFVDADCELAPDWLQRCISHLDNRDVVAAGGALRQPSSESGWVERSLFLLGQSTAPHRPSPVRWLATFNLLVRKSAFDQVGGFDESLVSCEDSELSYRLTEIGQMIYDPDAKSAHHGESRTLGEIFQREAWRSQGNFRVAVKRFSDWRNWASLAYPPVMIGIAFAAIITGALAMRGNPALWKWTVSLSAIFMLAIATLTPRLVRTVPLSRLPQVLAVYAAYLGGRAAGLFFSIPRVSRRAP